MLLLVTISVIIAWYYQIYSPPPNLEITIVVQHKQQMFILLYCICDAKPIVLVTGIVPVPEYISEKCFMYSV